VNRLKECFGKYDYLKEKCLNCEKRIECMMSKFEKPTKYDEWSDDSIEPNCFGSFKDRDQCLECPFRKACSRMSQDISISTAGKKIRISGKYKSRGKGKKEKDIW